METQPTSVTQGLANVALHRLKTPGLDAQQTREMAEKHLDRIDRVSRDGDEKQFISAAREIAASTGNERLKNIILARTLQQVSLGVTAAHTNSMLAGPLAAFASGVTLDIRTLRGSGDATLNADETAEARKVGNRLAYAMEKHAPNHEVKQLAQGVLNLQESDVSDAAAVSAQDAGMWLMNNAVAGRPGMTADNWLGIFGNYITTPQFGAATNDRRHLSEAVLRHIMTHTPSPQHAAQIRQTLSETQHNPENVIIERQRALLRSLADETATDDPPAVAP